MPRICAKEGRQGTALAEADLHLSISSLIVLMSCKVDLVLLHGAPSLAAMLSVTAKMMIECF